MGVAIVVEAMFSYFTTSSQPQEFIECGCVVRLEKHARACTQGRLRLKLLKDAQCKKKLVTFRDNLSKLKYRIVEGPKILQFKV